jgi:hypothetical protein
MEGFQTIQSVGLSFSALQHDSRVIRVITAADLSSPLELDVIVYAPLRVVGVVNRVERLVSVSMCTGVA